MDLLAQPLLDETFPLPLDVPFTCTQARAEGVSDHRLGRLVRAGLLRRMVKGVYVAAQVPDTLTLRAQALRLVVPDGCFVVDRTAGWLHGAEMILAPGDHLDVPPVSLFRPAERGRLRNGLSRSGERTVTSGDLQEVHGLVVTTPLRTALDLGRLQPRAQAFAAMDAMLRLGARTGTFSHSHLLARVERFARQRGVVQLRELAPWLDAFSESPGESALRLAWLDAGLPRPRCQVPVEVSGVVYRIDMGLEELRFGAEYDGEQWHDESREKHDRSRRECLSRQRGWCVQPFRRHNVYGLGADAPDVLVRRYVEARASYSSRVLP